MLIKVLFGALLWLVALGFFWQQAQRVEPTQSHPIAQVGRFLIQPTRTIELRFEEEQIVKVGDPVYSADETIIAPIGRIKRVISSDSTEVMETWADFVIVELYSTCPPLTPQSRFFYNETPLSLEWVLETMLPESKRREISQLIVDSLSEHRDELWADLKPITEKLMRDSQTVILEDLREALSQRSDLIGEVAEKYRSEFIEREVLPVVEREIWPIIERESAPLVQIIGTELWAQASLWRLTWKYLYDASPLPQRDLTRKEFNRFLNEKARPILDSHMPEILELQRRLFQEISGNPEVTRLMKSGLEKITSDEEIRRLVREVSRDVLVDNPRLRELWTNTWESAEMQALMLKANERLGPTITQIGEALFGNPRKKITPEFSDVLRSRVLFKDSRWLTLSEVPGAKSDPGVILPGPADPKRPFHVPATQRQ
jgi:hypothetical protein